MSKSNFRILLMALVAMSFFKPSNSLSQTSTPRKIQTPQTSSEFSGDVKPAKPRRSQVESTEHEVREEPRSYPSTQAPAPRRLQQHGIGIGLGQTFLFGNYAKYGQDKITVDFLYSYAASHSFDLLVDAHISEHKDNSERMKLMGLTGSIKARVFEYDNFSPFFLGGLGFSAPQAERNNDSDTTRKLTFGLNFGGGVDLRLNDNYVIGILAQMHWPFKVQQDQGSDLKGYYMKLLLTGMYLF
jgi:hypothetical protein